LSTVGPFDARFPTTRWSAVRAARSGEGEERRRGLDALLSAYWKPAYKHARVKWRASAEDAEDAVQSFFARAVENDFFEGYEPERGRFRTYFRVLFDRHVANLRKAITRQKRGSGGAHLDVDAAEQELASAGAALWESPDACFDREWRRELFARAVAKLRETWTSEGKTGRLVVFEKYDLAETRPTYEALSVELGISVPTVTNHLAAARREIRRLVIAELCAITETDHELREELGHVFEVASPHGGGR
jgi:RNA polymerase sigma factor (sigma-70 family)